MPGRPTENAPVVATQNAPSQSPQSAILRRSVAKTVRREAVIMIRIRLATSSRPTKATYPVRPKLRGDQCNNRSGGRAADEKAGPKAVVMSSATNLQRSKK